MTNPDGNDRDHGALRNLATSLGTDVVGVLALTPQQSDAILKLTGIAATSVTLSTTKVGTHRMYSMLLFSW